VRVHSLGGHDGLGTVGVASWSSEVGSVVMSRVWSLMVPRLQVVASLHLCGTAVGSRMSSGDDFCNKSQSPAHECLWASATPPQSPVDYLVLRVLRCCGMAMNPRMSTRAHARMHTHTHTHTRCAQTIQQTSSVCPPALPGTAPVHAPVPPRHWQPLPAHPSTSCGISPPVQRAVGQHERGLDVGDWVGSGYTP